ncbi:hypothetical protein VYU27_007289 [Nannochloropsis oceanica]
MGRYQGTCPLWHKALLISAFLLLPPQPFSILPASASASSATAAASASSSPAPTTGASSTFPSSPNAGDKMRQAYQDLNKQRQDMLDNVKDRLNKAKEMAGAAFGTGEQHVEAANEHLLEKVMSVMDETEAHGWEHVTHRRGITVHRKFMPALNGVMSKFCCVRASGVLEASCLEVAELFEGNTRVAEYNKYFAEGRDLEHVNNMTKVVWASSPSIFCFKPRDYCTYVHYRKHADGTIIVLNRAASHPEAPPSDKYVRAEVLMGASIIQPVPTHPNKCVFTTIAHINPGGLVPPFLVNKLCARGPVEFHNLVEKAAQRTRGQPKEVLKEGEAGFGGGGGGKYASAAGDGPPSV